MQVFLRIAAFICILITTPLTLMSQPAVHTLYVVGDAGEPLPDNPVGPFLNQAVNKSPNPATVLFLGDNIYPAGMPPLDSKDRFEAESILRMQAGWIQGCDCQGIFIPGNHDWKKGNQGGLQALLAQQQFVDSLKDERITFLPRDGCPGPVEIQLTDKTVLVIIDSQWPLHPWDKPGEESSCDFKTNAELLGALSDVYARNEGKRIILAAHHPVVTYGEHGGVYNFTDHVFPLTALHPNLYLPLPVVGSVYPLYRKWFGNVQDVAHPLYRTYSKSLIDIMSEYPGSIHVAGHEHSLQYAEGYNSHFVVSGSGSKVTHVKKKGLARYADPVNGLVQLDIFADGSTAITYWRVDDTHSEGLVTFRDTVSAPVPPLAKSAGVRPAELDTVVAGASDKYAANPWRKRMLGENYREEWGEDLSVPVFDIGTERGGLEILQKGGGMQTISLRLGAKDGREYTLRSIEKYPEAAVPEQLRKTFAQDLVEDQISASHPYGALVIVPMAEAVGVYHTNPKLVYIPDDPRLGPYQKTFGNMLALFEERPDEDWSHQASFANSENIIGTSKVLEKLREDNDNAVDEYQVVKSRLFDMIIGDWDRHDDQWRWATVEEGKDDVYKPIPRDRDQAFFVNEGILPKLWSRKWALPKFEGFDEEIDWAPGLSFNARYFDRTFLTGLEMDDWIAAAREIQAGLTDSVITAAIHQWPEEIYAIHGEEIIRKLKVRRDDLVPYATELYKFLAREVDVVGTDKHEEFNVVREESGDVQVDVYKVKKEGNRGKKIYSRHFKRFETKEIRLYGLGGNDRFNITGSSPPGIPIRIIGGEETDSLRDNSTVAGSRRHTIFYDKAGSSFIHSQGEVRDRSSHDRDVNAYDRKAFQYDRLAPLLYGNFNPDDGLFIGGGMLYQNHGFRKTPFRQRHIALFSIAPRTSSYNFLYRGIFTGVIRNKWNLEVGADIKAPNFVNNFFGWGNESIFDQDIDDQPGINADEAIDYYRFRFEEVRLEVMLARKIGDYAELKIGPAYQRIELEGAKGEDRFVYGYAETLPYDIFEEFNSYGGVNWELNMEKRDHPIVTKRGIHGHISGRTMKAFDGGKTFSGFDGSVSFYHTFQYPGRLIFALRAGGGVNTGDYEFYQAQILDGRTDVRGFRKTRFYGDSRFYSNMEVRLRLASLRTYIFPVSLGILGFHDLGRVWYRDAEGNDPSAPSGNSDAWHKSWGGGVWLTPFNMTVLSAELGHSDEGNLFYLRLGFLF